MESQQRIEQIVVIALLLSLAVGSLIRCRATIVTLGLRAASLCFPAPVSH